MQVIDLNDSNKDLYFVCLEDWSEDMKEAGNHKEIWYNKMKDRGLRVKFAIDDNGIIGGMIQYAPIEHSFVIGKDLYLIYCIWVHGHKQGRGDFRKHGMGKMLLSAAENDVRELGAKGIVAWGLSIPVWMKASWFKKRGYQKVDSLNGQILLWKPFSTDAEAPAWIQPKSDLDFGLEPDKVVINAYKNGWCPVQNILFERTKRAATEYPDQVVFREIDTFEKESIIKYGLSDAVFVNKKSVRNGPPVSYRKIQKILRKNVNKLPRNSYISGNE